MNIHNKKHFVYFTLVIFTLFLILFAEVYSNEGTSEDSDQRVLAIINDEIITLNEFNNYWNAIPEQYKVQFSKEELLNQLIIQELLVQKANELDLKNIPEIAFQIKSTIEQILIQYLIEKEIVEKAVLSEEEIKSYYEEHKEDYWKDVEVHALNILTDSEEQAKEALNKLSEGIDFSIVAQEVSIASSSSKGGDIGFIKKGTFTDDIESVIFNLNPGDVSNIIPTEKGFHIFKIIDKTTAKYIEFDEVKYNIEQKMLPEKQQQTFDEYLKDIENKAIIETFLDLIKDRDE